VFFLVHALGATEVIGKRHELRPVTKMPIAPAVAVGGGDRGSTERAPVIAALEGEHQALAALGVAHQLQAVLDGLATAHIEVDAALEPELLLRSFRQPDSKLDLLAMEVLAGNLW